MTAPYQLPQDLKNQPLGISWTTLGGGASLKGTPAEQEAAITSIAWAATSLADGEAGQTLRGTLNTETNYAPGHRVGVWPNGLARFVASRNPVLRVVAGQVAPANQLPQTTWTMIPTGGAYPEQIPTGIYNSTSPGGSTGGGQGILISGCYVNWGLGRMGTRVQLSYLAGWPHTQLTADVSTGDDSLAVDDVTAWAGAVGWISDGGQTEVVAVGLTTAVSGPAYNPAVNYPVGTVVSESGINYACLIINGPGTVNGAITPGTNTGYWAANPEPSGPGTLELLSPVRFEHTAPVLVTTLPASARWAVALLAKAQALERGVATMSIDSAESNGGGGLNGAIGHARTEAAIILRDLARVY